MLCLAIPAHAGVFTVTPVRIYMSMKEKAIAVTITNEGDEELVMQADVYEWRQKTDGTDDLTLTEDMLLSPPIIKVPGKSRQVIRLARLRPADPERQLTYRMIVREVPEARPSKDKIQLQLALAFSMPVFITPPAAKHKLDCAIERVAANSVNVLCENKGNAYAQPLEFSLSDETGKTLAAHNQAAYILPTVKRSFNIKSDKKPIPGGKAKLSIKLDDGSKQIFNVMLTE